MTARVFYASTPELAAVDPAHLRQEDFKVGAPLNAASVEEVERRLDEDGRPLRHGDVVYLKDIYWRLQVGGWELVMPGRFTEQLYRRTTMLETSR